MYPEHIPYLEESSAIAGRIAKDVDRNSDAITECVGEQVVAAYRAVMEGAEKEMKRVRNNLWLLQQNITLE